MSKSAAVADVGVEAVLCLHDEVVGFGNLRGVGNLLVGGIVLAEADVVAEGVVEKDGLLVDVADERPQVVYAEVLDVDAAFKVSQQSACLFLATREVISADGYTINKAFPFHHFLSLEVVGAKMGRKNESHKFV